MLRVQFGEYPIQNNQIVDLSVVQLPINLSWPEQIDQFYTVVLLDVTSNFLQLLIVNIPGQNLSSGDHLTQYVPPAPYEGTHLYQVFLYQQSQRIPEQSINRNMFRLAPFVQRNGLTLVDQINFLVESSSSGFYF